MPLIVQPAEDSDATRIAEIERLAYADSALTPILFPGPFPPDALAMRAEGLIAQRQADPTIRWLKVVDTDTNELIAFAKWNIINMPTPWTQSSQSSQQTQETQQQQQQEPNKSSRQFGPGCNVEACEEFFGGIHRRRDELVGGKECCSMFNPSARSNVLRSCYSLGFSGGCSSILNVVLCRPRRPLLSSPFLNHLYSFVRALRSLEPPC